MNTFTIHPAKEIGRFLLAAAAMAGAEFVVSAALAPINPMEGAVDAVFWRLFIGSAVIIGNAFVYFIRASRYHGLKLFGLSLLAYVGVAQLLGHVETIAFNFLFEFTPAMIAYLVVSQFLTALVFVPLAMLVAGKWKAPASPDPSADGVGTDAAGTDAACTATFPGLPLKSLIIRIAILGGLWYLCYMFAGYFIADPITHDYYAAKMENLERINAWLPFIQLFRGAAWAGLTILGIRIMNRPLRESGLIVGLIYGVFHAAGLLLPSEFMPAEMRLSHFPEIVLSLVMFCGLTVSTLSYRKRKA